MKIKSITDKSFTKYGYLLDGFDFSQMLETLCETSEIPSEKFIYKASDKNLENKDISRTLSSNFFGGLAIEVGYCNGTNDSISTLEYHRGCELNIAADDVILYVAPRQNIIENSVNKNDLEAFYLPAGQGVALYETTLHGAPCSTKPDSGFRVAVVLLKGTNKEKPHIDIINDEDKRLNACNKWLVSLICD